MCPAPAIPIANPHPERSSCSPVASAPPPAEQRLEQLFRYSLRHGQINPLLYVVLHYRSGERPT